MPVRDIRVQDRGSFFDDAFFKDSWNDFDTAMQRVLDRFDSYGIRVSAPPSFPPTRPHGRVLFQKTPEEFPLCGLFGTACLWRTLSALPA